jgi:DNA-directed RNA polymerase specialized sigma24 family protein
LLTLYSEDFSYKEIAEITGIKFSSVGKTLARALKKLQNEIETKK